MARTATTGRTAGTLRRRIRDRDPLPGGSGPLAELGRALGGRAEDVALAVAARWERTQGIDASPRGVALRAEILRINEIATRAVARFLATGQSPSVEQAAAISRAGRAPVDRWLSLAGLTKLYLYWHDAAAAAVDEESARLGVGRAVTAEALAVVRAGVDSSLVGMAKQFDVAYLELRTQLDEERARLAHRALHDPLTELPNRTLFLEQLRRALTSPERDGDVALLFIDIDHFKAVNDRAGHRAGDELLVTVADRLRRAVRSGDSAARLGGDEFVVLCTGLHGGEAEAETVAERICGELDAPVTVGGHQLWPSASVGVAVAGPGDVPETVLSHADRAMYLAKQDGRACHRLYRHAG